MVVGVVESAEITKSEIFKLRNASKFLNSHLFHFQLHRCIFQSGLFRIGLILFSNICVKYAERCAMGEVGHFSDKMSLLGGG